MSAGFHRVEDGPERDGAQLKKAARRRSRRWTEEDGKRWKESFESGNSILGIAAADEVDPKLVSRWLHRLGVEVYQGRHRVEHLPLKIPTELVELLSNGPDHVLKFLNERVWGLTATESGKEQLKKFCNFLELHGQGIGVEEIAQSKDVDVHRSTIAKWREGTDQPYLVKAATANLGIVFQRGWKVLPTRLASGANTLSDWIQVPTTITDYDDMKKLISQLKPKEETYKRAGRFEMSNQLIDEMRPELLGYAVGMMLGDAGKLGGQLERFASMNIDIQFTRLQPTNYMLGEFACMSFSSLGLGMHQIKDKEPSGTQLSGRLPSPAFRWSSERSPLLAWIFSACLGLKWGQTTSTDKANIEWIFKMPYDFRKRFVQALADSDGSVRSYTVEITSVPNAEFVTRLLHSLNLNSAYTRKEYGNELRTVVKAREAAKLPIFNEFVKGYRYDQLMSYSDP